LIGDDADKGNKKLAVVMADVSGKGVGAALFMAIAKTLIKIAAESGKTPGEVFETVNKILCENNKEHMFVTAFLGYVDFKTECLTFVNAGHSPPLVRRAGEPYDFLEAAPSFVIGGMQGMTYIEHQIPFGRGCELFLYTDGITEAMDIDEAEYGEQRLQQTLNDNLGLPLEGLVGLIKQNIDGFVKDAPQTDDITMLILKMRA
jgi:sigma-B regulation protein RsbU (phosphoserine phosphatase)